MTLAKDLFPLPGILFPAVSSRCCWKCPRPADKLTHHGSAWTKPLKLLNPELQTPLRSGAGALSQHMCEAFSAQHWGVGGYLTFNRFSHTKMICASWNRLFLMKGKKLQGTKCSASLRTYREWFSAGDHFCGWVVATAWTVETFSQPKLRVCTVWMNLSFCLLYILL